jgi:serine/threonine-protein kinase
MRELSDFGPYRIVRQIAVGGMAEIYLARYRGLEGVERTVVIKRILERYAHDAEFVTMFLDEARLLAALSHPNIAQVFDVGQVEQTYYLVMEHVRGPTLGRLLSAGRESGGLPRREALGIALSIAEALHYAHERRDELGRPLDIVHRDLNPSNVIVSYDGAVKLIDFGIAKAATKVYETRTGVVKGTYGYIAPEQLLAREPVDRRADVFALGILLYELVVGAHPYDVSDEPNLIDRIVQARYRPPREVRPDLPSDLDRLIARCLAPAPEGRLADMGLVIDALVRHLGSERMVPTQTALASLTRELVPDAEGPRPLKRLESASRHVPLLVAGDATKPVDISGELDGSDEWGVPTETYGPDRLSSEARTLSNHDIGPRFSDVEEEPSTVVSFASKPEPDQPSPTDVTWVPPVRRAAPTRIVLVSIVLFAFLAIGLFGFFGVRALLGSDREQAALPADSERAVRQAPSARPVVLRVVSEPAGAIVSVDGRPIDGVTPVALTLPADTDQVWLRLSKNGFLDQEREVRARVGEARFVLMSAQR